MAGVVAMGASPASGQRNRLGPKEVFSDSRFSALGLRHGNRPTTHQRQARTPYALRSPVHAYSEASSNQGNRQPLRSQVGIVLRSTVEGGHAGFHQGAKQADPLVVETGSLLPDVPSANHPNQWMVFIS